MAASTSPVPAPSSSDARPFPDRPRVAVVGAGAVGGYYGGRLAQHGHDVHFLLRGDYHAVRRDGLKVFSCDGDFDLPPAALRVYDDPAKMPRADLVLVTLKATGNDAFSALIRPLLHESTAVLTVQNGLGNEDRLAELFGPERVLGGMAFVCINREGPGVIRHIDHGLIRLGEFERGGGGGAGAARAGAGAGGASARAESIAALFRAAGVRCEVLDDLRRGRWEKLVWNVPFNGLGAALDLTTDRLIATETGRGLVERLMREVIDAARADGADLTEPLAGESSRGEVAGSREAAVRKIIDRQIEHTRTMGAYLTSMQIDRREGRPMEVQAILGEPLRRARSAGVDTPGLATLYELVSLVDGAPARPSAPA